MANPAARILVITTSGSPVAFIYALSKPNIEIDGVVHRQPWGPDTFVVSAGPHTVAISYPCCSARAAASTRCA